MNSLHTNNNQNKIKDNNNLIDQGINNRNTGIISESKKETINNINNSFSKGFYNNTEEAKKENNKSINQNFIKEKGDNNQIINTNSNGYKITENNQMIINNNRNEYQRNEVNNLFKTSSQLSESIDMEYSLNESKIKNDKNKDLNKIYDEKSPEKNLEEIENSIIDYEDQKKNSDIKKNTLTLKENKKNIKIKDSNRELNSVKKKKKKISINDIIEPKTYGLLLIEVLFENIIDKLSYIDLSPNYDLLEFDEAIKEDQRSFFKIIYSYELNNSIILFYFFLENDIFIRIAFFFLTITLYLFVNLMIMNTNSALNLYLRKNKEYLSAGNFCRNLFYPLSAYLVAYILKRKISIKDFLYEQYYQLYRILSSLDKNEITLQQAKIDIYKIEIKISKKKNKEEKKILPLNNIFTFIFLLFNFILSSSFCSIYENSLDCLIVNTLISILFSIAITRVLFLISSTIIFCSLRKKNKNMFIISCFLNPYYISFLSCKKIKSKN